MDLWQCGNGGLSTSRNVAPDAVTVDRHFSECSPSEMHLFGTPSWACSQCMLVLFVKLLVTADTWSQIQSRALVEPRRLIHSRQMRSNFSQCLGTEYSRGAPANQLACCTFCRRGRSEDFQRRFTSQKLGLAEDPDSGVRQMTSSAGTWKSPSSMIPRTQSRSMQKLISKFQDKELQRCTRPSCDALDGTSSHSRCL